MLSVSICAHMLRVSIGAHRQVIFVPSMQQHKFRQKYGEAFYWVEQQHGFA
jgi:hypothetical protein